MEYIEAIKEASASGSGYYLRALFGSMLLSSSLSRPDFVWEKTWEYLSDDLSLPETQIKNLTLCEIEKYLLRNNSSLRRFQTMPYPDHDSIASSNNRLIVDELSYDTITLQNESHNLISSLTDEQRKVFDEIMNAVEANKGGVFFLYGYGGTGKTFLWKTLSVAIRSKGQIVLNVVSSGIASLLLSGGRTAHSRFHIPINLNEDSTCSIKPGSDDAHLLKETKLIIWDEDPMIHKHAFEALDRTMTDVLTPNTSINSGIPFGGKVIVFGGDFRQVLPVITNGSRQQIVNASLCSSYIWGKCKLLRLTKNMRLTIGAQASDIEQTNQFAKWLLDIGEGSVGGSNDGEATIDIPHDLLINDSAILLPTNEDVQDINDRLISLFPRDEKEYLSSDSICPTEDFIDPLQANLYSPDVLNGLKISGLPNHRLVLKVGVPVMLLRNIDHQIGLCNGTRLRVISLKKHVVVAEIISGAKITPTSAVPAITALLVQPSANVPLGGTSAGGPSPGGPGDGASEAPPGGEAGELGVEGAGDGTAVGEGDGVGTAGAGAGTGVGDGDGGVITGAGAGVAVGETVGVAVGDNCAMIVVVEMVSRIKSFNIVEEVNVGFW
ncbi:uncharacterized protein LOC143561097 [Bidens hawaiensis]|uniref:uncharacterized protein LOC143561097 n=1 Tax=Bidens hawaiensis TaxID=980011 RepID=UPI00404AB4FA